MLEAMEQPILPEATDTSRSTYLLLESEILDEWLLAQPNTPEEHTIADTVRSLDFTSTQRWVWRETEYHDYDTRGRCWSNTDRVRRWRVPSLMCGRQPAARCSW
ncbi:hypothetical protein [Burkholderia cepacia]|uniref:hypothetical protein n=1 Tax=Burkholderia cepacia TaxID=292 RepID=UPI0029902783|nr:hypothetical protein [Burkholderia cepacia]